MSCGSDFETPAIYTHDNNTILNYKAYQKKDGLMKEVNNTDVPTPDLNGTLGTVKTFDFNDSEVVLDDYGDITTEQYKVDGDNLTIPIFGQPVLIKRSDSSESLTFTSYSVGEFLEGTQGSNTWVSYACGEYEACTDLRS